MAAAQGDENIPTTSTSTNDTLSGAGPSSGNLLALPGPSGSSGGDTRMGSGKEEATMSTPSSVSTRSNKRRSVFLPTSEGSNVVLSAWLTKQGSFWKTWKRRWFVLTTTTLSYYKDNLATKAKKTYNVIDMYKIERNLNHKRPFTFTIYIGKRALLASADNEEEVAEWMTTIEKILRITVYTTSQTASRNTRGHTQSMKTLLDAKQVKYDEVDVYYLDEEAKATLWARAGTQDLPQCFINGVHVGDFEALQLLEDNGFFDQQFHLDKDLSSDSG